MLIWSVLLVSCVAIKKTCLEKPILASVSLFPLFSQLLVSRAQEQGTGFVLDQRLENQETGGIKEKDQMTGAGRGEIHFFPTSICGENTGTIVGQILIGQGRKLKMPHGVIFYFQMLFPTNPPALRCKKVKIRFI